MSKPVQHHYLPKNAYLKFFQSSDKPEFVWMHQREEEPIFVNINNVAKERHLYSFKDENGQYNTGLESALAEMEAVASKIFEKLNKAEGPMLISAQEKSELAYFLAMQFARTPGFRDSLKEQSAEFARMHMKAIASNKEYLTHALAEIKKEKPQTSDISVEKMQEFIFSDEYTVEMNGKNYFLKQAIQLGSDMYPAFMMKDMFIIRSASAEFITSDYPVTLVPDPKIPPFYAGGFLMSGILIPIGTFTALFFKNPDDPTTLPAKGEDVSVGYQEVPPTETRQINKMTINQAERFLFGASNNPKIKELFNKTSTPKRFYTSSPFSRKKRPPKSN